jgi:hypothetical protein
LEEENIMPKFLAVHVLSSPKTTEQGAPLAKKVKANITVDAYWVRSWGQLNKEGKIAKLFCEWNATNIDAVRKVLAKIPELPTEGIYPMAILDAEDFR